jgi:hypothetical protein
MSRFSKMALDYSYGDLTELPHVPDTIIELFCEHNDLSSLPALPEGLVLLNCSDNSLSSLPNLPEGLTILNCSNNPLLSLPKLPEGLEVLDCDNTRIKTLPELPETIREIYLYGNDFDEPYKEFVDKFIISINDTRVRADDTLYLGAVALLRQRVNKYIVRHRLGKMLNKKARGLALRNVFTAKTGMTATRGPAAIIQRFLGVAPPKGSKVYNDESWTTGGRRTKKRSKRRTKRHAKTRR